MGVVTQRYTFSGSGEDFGKRKGAGLVILHTFENKDPLKNTMRDALAGAKWQDRDDVLGSYNRLIAVNGVLGCVPDDRISGAVNPFSVYFKPRTWLYDFLPRTVVGDPNSYALQLCAMGRRDYYDANGWPEQIIDGFVRSILEEEQRIGHPVVVANHADFQPGDRSDAGAIAMNLVMKRYRQITSATVPDTAMEIDMPTPDLTYVPQLWTAPDGAELREQADHKAEVVAKIPPGVVVFTVGESSDGKWRLGIAGSPERLFFIERIALVPKQPTPRDPELYAGIAAVVNARITLQPPPRFTQKDIDAATKVIRDSFLALQEQAASDFDLVASRATASSKAIRAKKP